MEKTIIIDTLKYKTQNQLGMNNEDIFKAIFIGMIIYYLLHLIFLAITVALLYLFFNLEIVKNVKIIKLVINFIKYLIEEKNYEVRF